MKTPYRDVYLDVRLSKPETAAVQKAINALLPLDGMTKLRPGVSDLAQAAKTSLTELLAKIGCDAAKVLPLLDGQVKPGPLLDPQPAADATPPSDPPHPEADETNTADDVPFGATPKRKKK